MRRLLTIILLLGLSPSLHAEDWDYKYLTLDELMAKSSLIVVAEIKTINEKIEERRVTQRIIFTPIKILKGNPEPKGFRYHASYENLFGPPESHYINSPPRTKYLLFLTKKDESYVSVLGRCGALPVDDDTERVFWYTDDSKPQRYANHWKEKPLAEVIARIKEKTEGVADEPAAAPKAKGK